MAQCKYKANCSWKALTCFCPLTVGGEPVLFTLTNTEKQFWLRNRFLLVITWFLEWWKFLKSDDACRILTRWNYVVTRTYHSKLRICELLLYKTNHLNKNGQAQDIVVGLLHLKLVIPIELESSCGSGPYCGPRSRMIPGQRPGPRRPCASPWPVYGECESRAKISARILLACCPVRFRGLFIGTSKVLSIFDGRGDNTMIRSLK